MSLFDISSGNARRIRFLTGMRYDSNSGLKDYSQEGYATESGVIPKGRETREKYGKESTSVTTVDAPVMMTLGYARRSIAGM